MKQLSRTEMRSISGGRTEDYGSCTVDCTGCRAYKCDSNCTESKSDSHVVCDGTRYTCSAYPTCWS